MECLHGEPASSPKLQMVYFFTAGKSLAVISSVHRMTVVKFKHSSAKMSRAQEAN